MRLADNAAILIDARGRVCGIDHTPTLETAQALVEGYVEALHFSSEGIDAQALFNEDGLRKNMLPNLTASVLVGRPLVGPVIILTGTRRWT